MTNDFVFGESNIVGESKKDNITRPAEVTDEDKLAVDSRVAKEFAVIDSLGRPKVSNERLIERFEFSQSTIQIGFTETQVGSGLITFPGEAGMLLQSGAATSSSIIIQKITPIKQPILEGIITRIPIQFGTVGDAGNVRSFGLNDSVDGWMIRLNGTSLEFVQLKGSVETITLASNWNIPVVIDQNIHVWTIQQKSAAAGDYDIWFNENTLVLVIRTSGTAAVSSSNKADLPLRFENINTTSSTNHTLFSPAATINAEGQQAVRIVDSENRGLTINPQRRVNAQVTFGFLFETKFDKTLDEVNLWDVTEIGGASFNQPANSYEVELITTTGATDDVELTCKLTGLEEGTGEFSVFEVDLSFGSNNPINHIKEWGYRDSAKSNGVFFRLEDDDFKFVTLKGGVESVTELTNAKPNADFHSFRIEHLGADTISGTIIDEEGLVVDFVTAEISRVGSAEKQPFLRSRNTAAPATTPSNMKAHWIRLLDNSGTSFTLRGKDGNGISRDVAVNANRSLLVTAIAGDVDSRVNLFFRGDVTSHPTVLVTFTVPTGMELDINDWHLATENAITTTQLRIDTTEKDAIRFTNSANTNRTAASFGAGGAIIALAAEVVEVRTLSGDTGKEFIAGLNGTLRVI